MAEVGSSKTSTFGTTKLIAARRFCHQDRGEPIAFGIDTNAGGDHIADDRDADSDGFLILSNAGLNLDFINIENNDAVELEVIYVKDGAGNAQTLSLIEADVLTATDAGNSLILVSDSNDMANLDGTEETRAVKLDQRSDL